ncbi:hypothetical protein TNCV_4221031 [Trichonephila clavipes]|nr:hypothetical protein TNCV_4221031 [Trichonephila clavipes]
MFDSSSYDNPTPVAHADASRDVLPRGGISQEFGTLRLFCQEHPRHTLWDLVREIRLIIPYSENSQLPVIRRPAKTCVGEHCRLQKRNECQVPFWKSAKSHSQYLY